MIGKIPTWWENSVLGNRKLAGKKSGMLGNFPQWEKKGLPLHGSLVLRHPSYRQGFNYPFSISVCVGLEEGDNQTPADRCAVHAGCGPFG